MTPASGPSAPAPLRPDSAPAPRLPWIVRRLARWCVRDAAAREGLLGDLVEERSALAGRRSAGLRCLVRGIRLTTGYAWDEVRARLARSEARFEPKPGGDRMLSQLAMDLRFAVRTLRKSAGTTLAAVLALTIGIGAATAMFGILNGVLWSPLPYRDPGQLAVAFTTFDGRLNRTSSSPDYDDYRAGADAFETLAAMTGFGIPVTITGGDEPHRGSVQYVTWDFFPMLGVETVIGRGFGPQDEADGGPEIAIVSHAYWRNRLGGRDDVVGTTLARNGRPTTVVGVLSPEYQPIVEGIDIWAPYRPHGAFAGNRQFHNWVPIGRLRDGVSLDVAQEQLDAIAARLATQYPDTNASKGVALQNLRDALVSNFRGGLLTLMTAVSLLLLIACGNVANLQLARGTRRSGELALRAALGAGRGRLVRQLLTESALLGLAAGALGLGLAAVLRRTFVNAVSSSYGIDLGLVGLDPTMLAFAIGVSLLTSLLFGALPALRLTPSRLSSGITSGARVGESASGVRLRGALVVGQVGLCVVLLIGAGLLIRGFNALVRVDPGFDTRDLLITEIGLTEDYGGAQRTQFFERLVESMEALPGVGGVAAISQLPIVNPGNDIYVYDARHPRVRPSEMQTAYTRTVLPGYFRTMGIPLLAGRDVTPRDSAESPPVMVINQAMATLLFPDDSPIGQRVTIDSDDPITYTVVGLVGNVRVAGLSSDPGPTMYRSYDQNRTGRMRLAVRAATDQDGIVAALRETVWVLDRNVPVEFQTMDTIIASSGAIVQSRVFTAGLTLFAGASLLLSTLGLYGLLAYYVNTRHREIGVRMALGAGRATVVSLVVRHGLLLAGAGLALGIALALPAARMIEQQLFGIGATDLTTFVSVIVFFAIVAGLASLIPAARATRVEPVSALRAE